VKKWHSIRPIKPYFQDLLQNEESDIEHFGYIIHFNSHFYTRYNNFLSKINEVLSSIKSSHSQDSQGKECIFFMHKVSAKQLKGIFSLISSEYSESSEIILGLESLETISTAIEIGFNPESLLLITSIKDVRSFEKQFSNLSQQNNRGVAFDIDYVTRGHIVLSEKFNLESFVTGVQHERHLEKLDNLNPDNYGVGI